MSDSIQKRFESAKSKWLLIRGEKLVSCEHNDIQKYSFSTGSIAHSPLAVLKPISQNELCEVVKIAREYSISIYPFSGGKNWGYGSSSPLRSNCVILDLSSMNKIIEVNAQLAYAVIEPGVTPIQLFKYFEDNNLPLRFDTSGAPDNSSLIGNICERGHGFTRYSDHYLNSCAYEVVLADGSLLKTGQTKLHKWGTGPSLDGLFTQSNFGIISKLTIWLLPKTDYYGILQIRINDDKNLGTAINKIRDLKLLGMFPEALHIYNKERVESSLQSRSNSGASAWNIASALYGEKDFIKVSVASLKRALGSCANVKFYSKTALALAEKFGGIFKLISGVNFAHYNDAIELLKGRPSNSHLRMAYLDQNKFSSNPDLVKDGCGIYWYAPILPASSDGAANFLKFIRRILSKYNLIENISLIFFNERCLCCILPLMYNKENNSEAEKSLLIYREFISEGLKLGYVPYRLSPEGVDLVLTNDSINKTNALIKQALDPEGIISPGRYSI